MSFNYRLSKLALKIEAMQRMKRVIDNTIDGLTNASGPPTFRVSVGINGGRHYSEANVDSESLQRKVAIALTEEIAELTEEMKGLF